MSRNRTHSDEGAYTPEGYSDDFVSDEDRTPTPKRVSTPHRTSHHQYYQDRFRGRGKGPGPARGRGRGRGARRGRGNSRASEPADMRKSHDSVTTRVLSASRNRINELRNKMEEMKIQIKDLEQENKLYKKLQFRQEKAIRGFEDKENDLPRILDKHNNEVRALKDQNRKLKEKYDKSDRYLRDAEDELERLKKKMKQYKEICEQKELKERDELSRKLTKAEIDLEERDVKIKELQRHIEMLKKNQRHELGIEGARQKDLKKQVDELTQKNSQLETQLKEKERALEYANIYSRPGRSSRDGSPDGSPSRKPRKKTASLTELTPRDKAKFYAEKRRVELLKQKELKAEQERKKRQKWEEEERDREKKAPPQTPPEFSFSSIDKGLQEREEMVRREEEERLWKEREMKEKQTRDDLERKQKELERRRDQENKARIEREEREREDRERRMREDRERREREERRMREEREKEDREQREREEREREERERKENQERELEKAEQERKLKQEREKLDNDPKLLEERRKKDELLRKLQAMDQVGSAGTNSVSPSSPTRKSKEPSRHSGFGDGFDTQSRRSEPKEYSFTKPVNNLHQGKPSHEDVHVPYLERQRNRRQSDDSLGGYQPSFGPSKGGGQSKTASTKPLSLFDDDEPALKLNNNHSSSTTTKTDKKSSDLLENLFGSQAKTSKTNISTKRLEDNETFFVTNKSPAPNHRTTGTNSTTFPWDSTSTTANKSVIDTDKKSTIFGGGAALIDDDLSPRNGKVLPRRQRQQNINTFSAKPSVMAVDNFDDDLEEVVL